MKGFTLIELLIVVAIVVTLLAVIVGGVYREDEHKKFMASCLEHEPEYSCEVKWKQVHPDHIVVFAPFNK